MIGLIVGTILLIASVLVITSAEKLSLIEKRLLEALPWRKGAGWAGTRRGALAWRAAGIVLAVCGIIWTLSGALHVAVGR